MIQAIARGQSLAGVELLPATFWQRLGLAEQATVGLREQSVAGLTAMQRPFPEGTFDINGGAAGLAITAVEPIRVQGRVVGLALVGSLLNRNYDIVDGLRDRTSVSTATLFAQDWRVSTNVPYQDGQTRAIGTRVSQEVAERVLIQQETFLGSANIIGVDYLTGYKPLYSFQKDLDSQALPIGIAYVGEPLTQVRQALMDLTLTGYGIGGGVLAIAALILIPVADSFSKPLQRLARFIQQVRDGNQGIRLPETQRQDEVGILFQELNQWCLP
ncbi:MAG: HAMP domain-containing protein [Chloroflexaceae bacterium]|nr:HAMP domain-containing protein [Chloroflexaceae bacterium]